jgi:hypothetical protein
VIGIFRAAINLKTAVDVLKVHLCFDPSASSGSARTAFKALTKLVKSPFALSSLRSGPVEGLGTDQLPILGLTTLLGF